MHDLIQYFDEISLIVAIIVFFYKLNANLEANREIMIEIKDILRTNREEATKEHGELLKEMQHFRRENSADHKEYMKYLAVLADRSKDT